MYDKIVAADLKLNFDFEKISSEIKNCRSLWSYTPIWHKWINDANSGAVFKVESDELYKKVTSKVPELTFEKELQGFYTLYLRTPMGDLKKKKSFSVTKYLDHKNWEWNKDLEHNIPYTIKCIESLPYDHIGLIRIFITENTFLPTHSDYDQKLEKSGNKTDLSKTLGISIVSSTGGVPLKIWSKKENAVKEIYGHCHIFRDSIPHGVPFTKDIRITIRIFGEVRYEELEKLIDWDSVIE